VYDNEDRWEDERYSDYDPVGECAELEVEDELPGLGVPEEQWDGARTAAADRMCESDYEEQSDQTEDGGVEVWYEFGTSAREALRQTRPFVFTRTRGQRVPPPRPTAMRRPTRRVTPRRVRVIRRRRASTRAGPSAESADPLDPSDRSFPATGRLDQRSSVQRAEPQAWRARSRGPASEREPSIRHKPATLYCIGGEAMSFKSESAPCQGRSRNTYHRLHDTTCDDGDARFALRPRVTPRPGPGDERAPDTA
jgi:hypothetical protein